MPRFSLLNLPLEFLAIVSRQVLNSVMKAGKHKSIGTVIMAAFAGVAITGTAADSPALENSKVRAEITAMHGKAAPELKLKDWINSKGLTSAELKGKIIVLDFWATWCGPCLAAVPKTNGLMKKYADKGVVIIGVCAVRGAEKIAETVKKHKIQYPVAIDDGTNKAFKANSYPDYYIIDRQGNLRWGDIRNGDVEKAIEILLKENDKA